MSSACSPKVFRMGRPLIEVQTGPDVRKSVSPWISHRLACVTLGKLLALSSQL